MRYFSHRAPYAQKRINDQEEGIVLLFQLVKRWLGWKIHVNGIHEVVGSILINPTKEIKYWASSLSTFFVTQEEFGLNLYFSAIQRCYHLRDGIRASPVKEFRV